MSILVTLLFTLQASALDTSVPGWNEFVKGQYSTSQKIGRTADNADGYAQACRSGLVLGGFIENGIHAIQALHSAMEDCDKALQENPNHFIAKMSLAIALSFEGRRLKRPRYAKLARSLLEDLVANHPQNPLGYGALAAWHSEVSAAGFMARVALGARRKIAAQLFEKAQKLGGVDYPLRFEFVKFLANGNKTDRAQAIVKARALLTSPTETSFDEKLRERCRTLISALETNKRRAVRDALYNISAFRDALPEGAAARFPLDTLSVSQQN